MEWSTVQDELGNSQFFVTPAHSCSYLEEQEATTLFLDPRQAVSRDLYQTLTDYGFRRSGSHLYRPHCRRCKACVATRIPVAQFRERRRHRRIRQRNADLTTTIEPARYTDEHFELYARYVAGRHGGGDMHPATVEQFRSFLLGSWAESLFLCSYFRGELQAVAVTDRQPRGLSAIYSYFDPEQTARSLGVFSILSQLDLCARWSLPYLYLGFWIKDSAKMRYKLDYRPIELLLDGRWSRLD